MNIQEYIDLRISLSGKTSRRAFWLTTLLHVVILLVFLCSLGSGHGENDNDINLPTFYLINAYFILMPTFYTTMMVRRMHDIGKTALLPICWLAPYLFVAICNVIAGPTSVEETASQEADAMAICVFFSVVIAGVCWLTSMVFALFRSKETENS